MADALDEAESFIHATEICSVPKESKGAEIADHSQRKDKSEKKSNRPNGTWAIEKKGYQANASQGQKRGRPYDKEKFEYNTDLYTILLDVSDRALDGLAAKGFLKSYPSSSAGGSGKKFYKKSKSPSYRRDDNDTDPEIVAVISGGLAAVGPTMRGQKDYASRLGQVMLSGKAPIYHFPKVEICESDRGKIATPHDDPLVIELKVANLKVRRILVDTGSSSDIISTSCLSRLEHDPKTIEKIHYPIIGFGGGIIHPQGIITLPLRVGGRHQSKNLNVRFLIVKDLTAYNIILGRPTLNQAKAVVVTHLMLMKYVCDKGQVDTIHGDQQLARDCYLTTLSPEAWGEIDEARASSKRKLDEIEEKVKETFTIATAHMETRRPEPVGGHYEIILDEARPDRTVPVGVSPDDQLRAHLVTLLREFQDIFSFAVEEMPGIDPSIAVHKLNVDESLKHVRQKKRNHGEARNKVAAEEVQKLLEAGFIRPSQYPDWVENVVLVPKPNKSWRMCVDYTDLNKACPKDSFPLPKIDRLVDSTAGHALMSFMDAYSGFHQIPLWPDDQEKTSFVNEQGLYCYKVMPFGLKNAPATFQRLVNTVFSCQLGRNIEAYIDDMIVKSKQREEHLADLRETFETLRKYQMRLNPKKCVFGVTTGKFLGFLIDERGIEANPDKVQAKKSKFEWTEAAETAFVRLKEHLHTLPRLVSPLQGETLYVYLAISEWSLSAVLLTEREGVQLPIYFVSHVLQNAELRYSPIEKFALALFMASKKLRPYFLAHKLVVYTDQPLKQPLPKLDAAGRMLKWAIELNAFDISYEPRKAIKGQAFADFIAEMTRPNFEKNVATRWTVYVDGSSTQNGCGAGIICQSPEGDKYEYATRFNFQTSNNEADYEALLAGIKMCKAAGAQEILAFSDSRLIVSQVNGDYEARDPNMIKYMQAVHQEIEHLKSFKAKQIPRTENNQADALSKLASSASCDTSRHVFWEVKDKRSIEQELCAPIVAVLDQSSTWMDPIIAYKMDGTLPDDSSLAAKIQKKSYWFEWWNGVLYKKSFSRPLLRCVTPEKGKEILDDLHQGLCSSHIGGRALAEKALRTGYYWPTLREDALAMVQKCDKCQRFAHLIHRPAHPLTPIMSPIPFAKWGMDLLGPYC
nr:uncharacterized protein LOC110791498 [Spinacia oleracea]